jgi:hypothetical protein
MVCVKSFLPRCARLSPALSLRSGSREQTAPTRWVGLDLHKEYLLATGVNAEKQQVFGPSRCQIGQIEAWAKKHLTKHGAVILEMTTNTWKVYDLLLPWCTPSPWFTRLTSP